MTIVLKKKPYMSIQNQSELYTLFETLFFGVDSTNQSMKKPY